MRASASTFRRLAGIAASLAALGGCATFSDDRGFGPVQSMAKERIGQMPSWQRGEGGQSEARKRADELLLAPLTPESAVEVALLNNPGLQASYLELSIAEADLDIQPGEALAEDGSCRAGERVA